MSILAISMLIIYLYTVWSYYDDSLFDGCFLDFI